MSRADAVEIREETNDDLSAVRQVNRLAFDREMEARLVDSLRREGYAAKSLVAEVEEKVVGHILFSRIAIAAADGSIDALSLAPLAVLPEFQRRGVGARLVEQGLVFCREAGHRIVLVLGDPHYYQRFGFSADLARPLESEYAGEAFMARELQSGALANVRGQVVYPPPFAAV